MFYSETLLSKTGPLARVWLSANLERKLSKAHILQSDIESSVHAIVDQGQAPMALQLSGQLLLGVVRIYSRKTRYLLDDCNEALMKIKMAFRLTNNNDLPATVQLPPGGITLPDVLTESDLFMNLDTSILFSQPLQLDQREKEPASSLGWSSQLLPDSSSPEKFRHTEKPHLEDDTGLILDLGEEDTPLGHDTSIEVGRNAPAARSAGEDLFSEEPRLFDDDLDLDLGEDSAPLAKLDGEYSRLAQQEIEHALQQDEDLAMANTEELGVPIADESTIMPAPENEFLRDSQSPLSSARSSVVRDMDDSFMNEDALSAPQQQRTKRRKLIKPDADTFFSAHRIKEQQDDRSKILRPESFLSFLPRDPVLLTLITMQENGEFASSVMGGTRAYGWAPELRDILSIESVRQAGQLKRKRDSGISDMDIDGKQSTPILELEEESNLHIDEGIGLGADASTILQGANEIHIPGEAELQAREDREDWSDEDGIGPRDDYDEGETTIRPVDTGPISLGTKHAVHILRDQFGGASSADASSQPKAKSVLFQDLLPEEHTSKSDATKMFFEVLVLATKDAVKVEQSSAAIGGRLRIRAKQALWGSWAETEAGGEIAVQDTEIVS
ncbi:sister chromatid cohesion protein 1 [Ophidiomyces ophidiicola]|nr:sister chromatid cohesion protein 1 [Ophidiomyces ophidiicola]